MCSNPRLHSGRAECVHATPDLAHHGEIRLLGDPLEHLDPVLEGGGVAALRREPVPHGDDDGVAELGDPPAEGVVGRRAAAPGDEPAAVELHDDGQPPARRRRRGARRGGGVRDVAAVGRCSGASVGGGGCRGRVAGAARVGEEVVRVVGRGWGRGEEDADGEGGVGVDVEVLGGDAVGGGEGRVGWRGGLVGAAGDPEGGGCGGGVRVGPRGG